MCFTASYIDPITWLLVIDAILPLIMLDDIFSLLGPSTLACRHCSLPSLRKVEMPGGISRPGLEKGWMQQYGIIDKPEKRSKQRHPAPVGEEAITSVDAM